MPRRYHYPAIVVSCAGGVDSRSAVIWRRTEGGWTSEEFGGTFVLPCPPIPLAMADLHDGASL